MAEAIIRNVYKIEDQGNMLHSTLRMQKIVDF